ncbi:MAG: hypothetical protein NTZ72_06345 [Afipia sp.]|nr:hypothetical protein [Afipia sp.]
MRIMVLAVLAATFGTAFATPSHAGTPAFKGNDTGGIIAYSLFTDGVDIKALAVNHCASYGKSVRLTGAQATYGGYISFECVWVHPGYGDAPLRAAY